jgi:murein L,D-transpeptidase YafK
MPTPIYRILACVIPLQAASLLAFAWYSTRPPKPHSSAALQADHLVIDTSSHRLTLYAHGRVIRTYSVALGRARGAKEFEGDHKTPVGHYTVDGKNPHSTFHMALHLSYPSAADWRRAAAAHKSPGNNVEIHGLPPAFSYVGGLHRALDWTDGCIAVTNSEIEEISRLTPIGAPVDINP